MISLQGEKIQWKLAFKKFMSFFFVNSTWTGEELKHLMVVLLLHITRTSKTIWVNGSEPLWLLFLDFSVFMCAVFVCAVFDSYVP